MLSVDKYWEDSILFKKCSIIEDFYSTDKCDLLLNKINHLRNNHEKYLEVNLTRFNHEKTFMNYYQFDFINNDNFFNDFIDAFDYLLKIYRNKGFKSPWNSIKDCHNSNQKHSHFLNPLIFEYIPPSNFDWHLHKPKYQKFQLVINLSKRGRDYENSLFEIMKDNKTSWKISKEHKQGSILSFPYGMPHRVTDIRPLKEETSIIQRHVQLVMPIHPKEGFEGSFVYLNNFSNKSFPLTSKIN